MSATKSCAVDESVFQCSPCKESCSNDMFFDDFSTVTSTERTCFVFDDKMRTKKGLLMDEHNISSNLTSIQYFLASLCDFSSWASADISARCYLVEEVQEVCEKLKRSQPVNAQTYKLNTIIAALKEYFRSIPDGLFGSMSGEFFKIPLDSPLQITLLYLQSIVRELPQNVTLVSYLFCKALKNVIYQKIDDYVENCTDLLLHFTPVLFRKTLGNVDYFLRAARVILVMIDNCDKIFSIAPIFDESGNFHWPQNQLSEEECFFQNILHSLGNLEATLACDDSGVESDPEEVSSPISVSCSPSNYSSAWSSTYNEPSSSMDVSLNNSQHQPQQSFYHFTYIETDDQLSPLA